MKWATLAEFVTLAISALVLRVYGTHPPTDSDIKRRAQHSWILGRGNACSLSIFGLVSGSVPMYDE